MHYDDVRVGQLVKYPKAIWAGDVRRFFGIVVELSSDSASIKIYWHQGGVGSITPRLVDLISDVTK
tara:strand:- start:211 stop:408 length:198 start_codon:yes stop_codon:yes gene_type:complete